MTKSLSTAFAIVLLTGFIIASSMFSTVAAADVVGILNSDTIWTASSRPFNLMGPVAVSSGVTLVIEPGVTVNAR